MKLSRWLIVTALLFCVQPLWAQVQVTGKVTDAKDGTPIPGVTVTVKNTNNSTVTNTEGVYSISAPANGTLVFSSVGFGRLERPVSGTVNAALNAGENTLNEVVVTGYTTQTRRASTGSIARVRGDEVRLQPVATFEQQLVGKAPGVLIQSGSGQPGAPANVVIRGKGSVLGSTQPLYIVDGIQISPADFQGLNPSDFESYNILKDAVSTSQYGSRGANGVIVITTKKGTANRTRLTYDYQYGVSELPENKLKLMTAAEKIAFELSADPSYYGSNPNGWTDEEADSLSKVNGNWAGALFRKARTQQHQISLTGGSDRTRFFISGSVFDQQGVVVSTGLKRYTGRMNLDHTAGDFRLSLNAFLGSSKFQNTYEENVGIGSPLNAIRWHLPYVTPYLPDGSYNQADDDIQGQPNALQELLENPRSNNQLKGIGTFSLEYRAAFLPGLTAKTNIGVDFTDNTNQQYISPETYLGSQQTGSQGAFSQGNNRNRRYTITNSIGYRKQSGDHSFGLNLFNELIKSRFTSFNFTGYGLVGAFRNAAGIIPGTPTNNFIPEVGGNETNSALLSYFAIGDYSYRGKYFLNATVRRDGASRLAQDRKWTTFGSVGASWVLSSEEFMRNSFFSDLKLKVGYGSSANSNVGNDYEAFELFGPTSYNGAGGLVLVNLAKPNLTWEIRNMFNAGVDFGIFNNRLTGTVEVYNSVTNGLYLNRQISGTSGVTSILTNLGRMRNRGIEASITAAIFKGPGFNWTITANHTYNQNRILELDGGPENINGLFINRVGESQNSLYLVRYAGVDKQTGESIYLTKEGKETKTYDPNDRVIVGRTDPPHFGGLTNTFNYKGLELSVLFSYVFGNKVYNNDRTNVENPGYYYSSFAESMLNAWKTPGQETNVPSLVDEYHPETTRYVEDGKFLRLRNVSLSYALPVSVAGKIKASTIRFFVQGQNLYTWHKVLAYDPEVPSGNLLGAQYPPLRSLTVGATIGF